MISIILSIISIFLEYIIVGVVSILAVFIVYLFIFDKSPRRVLIRFLGSFLGVLFANIFSFFIFKFLISEILGTVSKDLGVTSLLILISLTIIFNFNLILKLKVLLLKAKKLGDLSEVSVDEFNENRARVVSLLTIFSLIVIPMLVVGYGDWEIFSVLIYVLFSLLICLITSAFLFPYLFSIFNKVIK